MQFATVSIIKHPLESVWDAMQNRLPDIATQVDDIAEIIALERSTTEAGHDLVVNVWKAAPPSAGFSQKHGAAGYARLDGFRRVEPRQPQLPLGDRIALFPGKDGLFRRHYLSARAGRKRLPAEF
jgi:hypothetical protein